MKLVPFCPALPRASRIQETFQYLFGGPLANCNTRLTAISRNHDTLSMLAAGSSDMVLECLSQTFPLPLFSYLIFFLALLSRSLGAHTQGLLPVSLLCILWHIPPLRTSFFCPIAVAPTLNDPTSHSLVTNLWGRPTGASAGVAVLLTCLYYVQGRPCL
ncbi:hypothetical protein F4819DRAFT_444683 [Hypoxylon fuscum]|nr:hypothetical protein F4819DRAFT_444683 [Hypoxylon fuscum]